MSQRIPVLDLSPEIEILWDRLTAAMQRVVRSGQFIMGPDVAAFEQEVAQYLDVPHAVGLNSGTDALLLALRALGVGPGDEVITSPFTFIATAEAVSLLGATPVFVDIDPRTFALDVARVADALTPRTKAVIPVHLYGHAADMDALTKLAARHKLHVVEDVAQAFGGRFRGRMLGTIGQVGAFSFFPSKTLGAFGDAGLVATRDESLAETVRMLRAHGSKKKYFNEILGYNSRLDTLQAAILRVKLPHIDAWNEGRRRVAARYDELLRPIEGLSTPHVDPAVTHVFHQYTVRILGGRRDAVQARLAERGIGTMVYYPTPVHKLPVYSHLGLTLPEAERASAEVLSLPIWPTMPTGTQDVVVRALRDALLHS